MTVPEVLPLVRELYGTRYGGAGCCLHCVLDDGNIENGDLDGALEYAKERGHDLCHRIAIAMRCMTRTQRSKIIGSKYP